uniref:STI1 domain-containing protein n=1 Tax=Chromera velia CCMP2878 TaxID=1169474 RepID=A0A0G4G8R2_9ALVE|eukprot:Cvel_20677.t1-p1 / transcript=Cvel_20677.t1 / gene=Cvel_20677 / organism=Chromera_velia_CCMP2878 / gene_product=STI1-like protein, putative / transcript_product=STI1-like protein, putative / location=Cvel_scaffold1879:18125-21251(+) / protein_length=441 / sequence_SO=supercontig / SO=protein_coding / is_pseudo=false
MNGHGGANQEGGLKAEEIVKMLQKPKFQRYMGDVDFQEAVEDLLKNGRLDPNHSDPRVYELCLAAATGVVTDDTKFEEEAIKRKEAENRRKEAEKARREAEAKAAADAAEAAKPPEQREAEALRQEGNALYKKKEFDAALQKYRAAAEKFPTDLLVYGNIAAVHLEQGNFAACEEECKKALEKRYEWKAPEEKVAKIFCRLASCYQKQKKYDDAIAMYNKALMEDNNRQTRAALAEVEREKEKAAAAAYENPELAEEKRQEGNKLFQSGQFVEAKAAYDEAIKRNPKDVRLYSNRAAVFCKLFEYPTALKDVEKALAIDESFVKAWSRKGTIHTQMKEYNKAMEAYRKGLSLDPENKECKAGLENVIQTISATQGSDKPDQAQIQAAMQDPEIQKLMRDPQFQLILQNMQEDPKRAAEYMRDPKIREGIQKLAVAGIIRLG